MVCTPCVPSTRLIFKVLFSGFQEGVGFRRSLFRLLPIPAASTGCERVLLEKASHSLYKQSCASEGSYFSLCI